MGHGERISMRGEVTQRPRCTRASRWVAALGYLASATFVGCVSQGSASDDEKLAMILERVKGESMRQLWREAYDEERLPDLATFPIRNPDERVSERRRQEPVPLTRAGMGDRRRPEIIEEAKADILFFAPTPVFDYQGPFKTIEHLPGRIVGRASGRNEAWEILYKVPDEAGLPQLATGSKLHLIYSLTMVDGSVRERLELKDAAGGLLLFFLSDGDGTPYHRSFDHIPLAVQQKEKNDDGIAPVAVMLRRQSATLKPGQAMRVGSGDDELELYLMVSFYTKKSAAHLEEGNPYYVTLVLYRPGP